MKEWWHALSLRDKRILCLGGFIIAAILFYEGVLHPLITKNQSLHQQIQTNKQLIVWMRAIHQEIYTLEKKPTTHFVGHSALSVLQDELKKSNLLDAITELKQAENNAVKLNFQAIYFDRLMTWIIKMYKEQGFVVVQMEVSPHTSLGMVNGTMVLRE